MDSFVLSFADENGVLQALKSRVFEKPVNLKNQLARALEEEKQLLQQPFKNVKIGFFTPYFTLVPERLFNTNELPHYLANLSPVTAADKLYSSHLSFLSAQLVYAVPAELIDLFQGNFKNPEFCHALEAMLSVTHVAARQKGGNQVFVNFRGEFLDVIYYDDGALIFCNSSRVETAKDILYFTMLVFDQFKLSAEDAQVHFSGSFLENSDIFSQLSRYIRNVHFMENPDGIVLGEKMQREPKHFFLDSLALILYNKS